MLSMKELRSWCEAAKLCVRCYLRLTPRTSSSAWFGGRDRTLCRKHQYSAPDTSLACSACLGILSDRILDLVPQQAEAALGKLHHDNRYKVNTLFPTAATLVRDRALWVALRQDFPTAGRPRSVREVFKLALTDRLDAIGLRYAADASLLLDVSLSHPPTESEIDYFCTEDVVRTVNVPSKSGGKRPRGAPSTSSRLAAKVLDSIDDEKFLKIAPEHLRPPQPTDDVATADVKVSIAPFIVAGEYNKYSRVVSQTPWLASTRKGHFNYSDAGKDGKDSTSTNEPQTQDLKQASNVEGVVTAGLQAVFQPERTTFTAGGREDVDVRMLGAGRPFIVEVLNPCVIESLVTDEMLQQALEASARCSDAVTVHNLRIASSKNAAQVRACEGERRKRYRCVVWTERAQTEAELRNLLEVGGGFMLYQKTPLRVLHRRTLATRERRIYSAKVHRILTSHVFMLDLITQAGTYVKEGK